MVNLRRHIFVLMAFVLPLTIRAIPELIAGHFPIGYDTIGSYVPIMLDLGAGNFQSLNPMMGGWLTFAIFGLLYWATRQDPVLILKIAGPVLYGVLGVSQFLFARRNLAWDRQKSLLLVIIASAYFVSLRISLDLFRNTLGISLLLLTLVISPELKTRGRVLLFAIMVWLVSITHLLVATILFSFLILEYLKRAPGSKRRLLASSLGLGQYILSLAAFQTQGVGLLAESNSSVTTLANVAFPLYIFLPLIPLAILGYRGVKNRMAGWWLAICVFGVFAAVTPISISSQLVMPYRWALMMSFPMVVYATEGQAKLRSLIHISPNIRIRVASLWLVGLLVLGGSYVALPVGHALPFFQFFSPPSMLQSTVPLEDSNNTVNALSWLSNNTLPNSVLMAHNAFYGWARLYFHGNASVVGYSPDVTLAGGLNMTLEKGYGQIYTIWWTDDSGSAYNQSRMPQGFELQHQEGRVGIFLYRHATG